MENKFTLLITESAKKDIAHSLDYIANDLFNKKAADDLYIKINKAIEVLREFPFSQPESGLSIHSELILRKYVIENYVLFYLVKDSTVTVLRFIYGGRDIDEKYF